MRLQVRDFRMSRSPKRRISDAWGLSVRQPEWETPREVEGLGNGAGDLCVRNRPGLLLSPG